MDTKVKNERKTFENVVENMRNKIHEASVHFFIWEKLYSSEDVVDIVERYKGFFVPTRLAHRDRFVSKVSDITSTDIDAPSIYHVLKMIERNQELAPDVDVGELRRKLKKHKQILRAINYFRNKRVDHWNTTVEKMTQPVFYGRAKKMLEDLREICDEITGANSGDMDDFGFVEKSGTICILEALKEKIAEEKKWLKT